jgi:hypothetical protein
MDAIVFWILGGGVTAVILYQVWRYFSYRSMIQSQSMDYYLSDGRPRPPLIARIIGYVRFKVLPPETLSTMSSMQEDVLITGVDAAIDMDELAPPVAMGIGDEGDWEEEMEEEAVGAEPVEDVLRMDVAVPPKVEVGRAFDLAVALRLMDAPKLAEADLTKLASGPVAITWEDESEKARVRILVSAPDCDVDTPEQPVTLTRHQNEPPVYFLLTPHRTGPISIQVKVYQETELLGNARIKTEVATEVGQVAVEVTSHPLSLTLNDRRLLRQNLTDGFDLGELHDLIFLLGLDKDNFPQEKDELIIDLIQTCLRQGLLRDLLTVGAEKRPLLSWQLECLTES